VTGEKWRKEESQAMEIVEALLLCSVSSFHDAGVAID
jgi:hypothetical protein